MRVQEQSFCSEKGSEYSRVRIILLIMETPNTVHVMLGKAPIDSRLVHLSRMLCGDTLSHKKKSEYFLVLGRTVLRLYVTYLSSG